MIALKEIKQKISADSYSHKDNVFTLRWGFFYKMGKTTERYIQKVKDVFPNANIIDSGEVWKSFRGGASVANSSHWFVKFTIPE
jgi:hypothetical protein